MITVELWALYGFAGLVVAMPGTGIVWTNQAGGTACQHPHAEGVFVPLPFDLLCWTGGPHDPMLNERSAPRERVQAFIDKIEGSLSLWFEPDSTHDALEAWVPVRIRDLGSDDQFSELLRPFAGRTAFVVYPNSD